MSNNRYNEVLKGYVQGDPKYTFDDVCKEFTEVFPKVYYSYCDKEVSEEMSMRKELTYQQTLKRLIMDNVRLKKADYSESKPINHMITSVFNAYRATFRPYQSKYFSSEILENSEENTSFVDRINGKSDYSNWSDVTYDIGELNKLHDTFINIVNEKVGLRMLVDYLDKKSYQEISDKYGIKEGTVKSKLNSVKKQIKSHLLKTRNGEDARLELLEMVMGSKDEIKIF